ncbi:MAG TPA: hypothetical protein VKF42_11845, partial [Chitinivibrionales bacterium]|nr:hypothetical protein [Chitinivibrionales bacterium]
DPETYEEKAAAKHFIPKAAEVLQILVNKISEIEPFSKDSLDALFHACAFDTGSQIGELVHPARLAVSGVSFGPGLFEMMEILGKETVVRRIRKAIDKIADNK